MVGVEFNSDRLVWGNEGMCCGNDSLLEWSVLDAQWFGVAQRRRRLFLVLDTGDWSNRRTILLESKKLRGDSPPSSRSGTGIAPKAKRRINSTISKNLDIFFGGTIEDVEEDGYCFDMQAFGVYGTSNIASTIKGRDYKDATDLIVDEYTCAIPSNIIGRKIENGGNGAGFNEDVMYTLTGADHHAIAYSESPKSHVRRLTPIECERLQGFPDNWTNVNNAPFSKRINALGRSMAVPVIQWIGKQIESSYD
jgi:DNA (cytosine-5)-methyltransferase 1